MIYTKIRRLAFRLFTLTAALPLLSSGCSHPFYCSYESPCLISIHIIDRNGLTETVSNPDRLKEYACIDFLKNQPYKKVLRVFSRDPCGNTPSTITSYYENGQVQKYLEVVNNRAFGSYYEWYDNGTLHLHTNIIGGVADITMAAENTWLFDGPAEVWDECGNILAYINYCKGKLEGESSYYHTSGSLWKKCSFSDGKEEGIFEIYYKDGSTLQTTQYSNGKRHGQSIRYWNCGSIAAIEEYTCGKLIEGKYLDRSGTCVSSICNGNGQRAAFSETCLKELHTYVNGVPDGEVRVLGPDGTVVKTWLIRDEEKHGVEIEYYPSFLSQKAQPKMEVTWYKGKIHGTMRTWYNNGYQESQREMTNNIKNGVLTAWYRDGSLMLVEEYEDDTLVKGEYYRRGEKSFASEVEEGNGLAVLYDGEGNFLRKVIYRHGRPYEP
ncbi:MAG: hypothetical protein WC222_03440 [Parachlamydiales bacterium]|jgi:antitoxin component YwqK of YwqJK toxin-antitoxin module